jgi:hypothetical protein
MNVIDTISYCEISWTISGFGDLLMICLVFLFAVIFLIVFPISDNTLILLNLCIILIKLTMPRRQVRVSMRHLKMRLLLGFQVILFGFVPYYMVIAHLLQLFLH